MPSISLTVLSAPTAEQLDQHQLGYEHMHEEAQLLQKEQIQDLPTSLICAHKNVLKLSLISRKSRRTWNILQRVAIISTIFQHMMYEEKNAQGDHDWKRNIESASYYQLPWYHL